MTDILERPTTLADYRTMDLIADISELHLDARQHLMSVIYEFREREEQLKAEIQRLRRGVDGSSNGRSRARNHAPPVQAFR